MNEKWALADAAGQELWYRDVKAPLEPFEGGHGFVGALGYDGDGRPGCHYCGRTFDGLGIHASKAHGLSAREYKREVGLSIHTALVSEQVRTRQISRGLASMDGGNPVATGKYGPAGTQRGDKRPKMTGRQNPLWTPEHLNKKGRCYEQVLSVCRSLIDRDGKLTRGALRRAGVSASVVDFHGGLERLAGKAGGVPFRKRGRWDDRALLIALRDLAAEVGRTPSQSDVKRHGLPHFTTYVSHFGSWNGAIRRAGLPINLAGRFAPITVTREVAILSRYAITGSVTKTAAGCGTSSARVTEVLRRYGIDPVPGWQRRPEHQAAKEMAAEVAGRLAHWPEVAA